MKCRILLTIVISLLFAGCSVKPYAHITTQSDPEFISSKSDKVFVFTSDNDGVSQRKLDAMIKNEMKNSGINIVNSMPAADYIVFAGFDERTESGTSYMYVPKTSYSSGYIGKTSFSGTETSTEAMPYHYTDTDQIVYLFLHRKTDLLNNKKRTVWEGKISVDKDDYNKHSTVFIRELLRFFGKDHESNEMVDIPN